MAALSDFFTASHGRGSVADRFRAVTMRERSAFFSVARLLGLDRRNGWCAQGTVRGKGKSGELNKRKPRRGQRMIESARQALAFAKGKENHGYEVHVPDDIDVTERPRSSLSDSNRT